MAKINRKRKETPQDKVSQKTIDLGNIYKNAYKYVEDNAILDISAMYYSNTAYLQVSEKDVMVDFTTLPGPIKEGRMKIDGVRVIMSHDAAQALVDRLGNILKKSNKDKTIPQSEPSQEIINISPEMNSSIKEEKT